MVRAFGVNIWACVFYVSGAYVVFQIRLLPVFLVRASYQLPLCKMVCNALF